MITRPVSTLQPGTAFGRMLKTLVVTRGRGGSVEYAQHNFSSTPHTAVALEQLVMKSAVAAASTASAAALEKTGVFEGVGLLLQGLSAFDGARSRMRELPFDVPVPRELEAGTGGDWVGEGIAVPVIAYAFDYLRFRTHFIGAIAVITQELARIQRSELTIRDVALNVSARTTDRKFLDPASGATAAGPASITNGVAPVAWTDAATTLAELLSRITTSGRGLAWILNPKDAAFIAAGLGAASDLPRTLLGLPVIPAPYAPTGQVTLVDLAEIAFADGGLDVDVTEHGSLQMDSAPTNASTDSSSPPAPVPTQVVSLWQTDSIGLKVTRIVDWAVVRDGAVAYTVLPVASPA